MTLAAKSYTLGKLGAALLDTTHVGHVGVRVVRPASARRRQKETKQKGWRHGDSEGGETGHTGRRKWPHKDTRDKSQAEHSPSKLK
jgi:hypothetical protein